MENPRLLSDAADLFNRKLYFECHELLEDAWRESRGEEKQFLQGLIMLSVAMYHAFPKEKVLTSRDSRRPAEGL
jgi:predicted metal-dependent hydrolase